MAQEGRLLRDRITGSSINISPYPSAVKSIIPKPVQEITRPSPESHVPSPKTIPVRCDTEIHPRIQPAETNTHQKIDAGCTMDLEHGYSSRRRQFDCGNVRPQNTLVRYGPLIKTIQDVTVFASDSGTIPPRFVKCGTTPPTRSLHLRPMTAKCSCSMEQSTMISCRTRLLCQLRLWKHMISLNILECSTASSIQSSRGSSRPALMRLSSCLCECWDILINYSWLVVWSVAFGLNKSGCKENDTM
jgi:hypothetical protein